MDEDMMLDKSTIIKSAMIEPEEVMDEDLRKINRYALTKLTADDVFVFKTVIGDNETDDRNFEPFDLSALKDLEKLYPGKPVIKDHRRSADNQVARVFDAQLVSEDRLTKAGEPFSKVVTKNYLMRTEGNADLIREIQGGIKKEVSTGVIPKRLICNICGSDNMKTFCPHWPGREYDKESGKTTCLLTISGVKEACELSLVAVPAQPRAGAIKQLVSGRHPEEDGTESAGTGETSKGGMTDEEVDLRIRLMESFLFAKQKGEENE